MSYELAYYLIHVPVIPAWLLLFLAPKSELTRKYVHSGLLPVVIGLIYAGFLVAAIGFGQGSPDANMSNLAGVTALFSAPIGVLTGWSHYLVFDLFVGAWIGRDALRRGVFRPLTFVSQFFSLMFGPIGLLIYVLGRKGTGKGGWSLFED